MDILALLRRASEMGASDLHLSVNSGPIFRIHGELQSDGPALTAAETEAAARTLMTEEQWRSFETQGEVDLSYSLNGVSRFRINVYRQRNCVSVAVRVVAHTVPSFESLHLPKSLLSFCDEPDGLVLVTGPTGSGKSTTLAAMIDHINQTQRRRIITLEDPIEYLHRHNQSIIDQREIGLDTRGFAPALRAALRQDPDVILVGELRDLETISTAITAAETGHLVFATLHTGDAVQSVDRLIDVFPPNQQTQVRIQLATVLRGVITQRLHKALSGSGRVAATEVLVNTPAVSNLIRSEKTHQIRSIMQTGRAVGMQTMEMSLRELIAAGLLPAGVLEKSVNLGMGVL